MEKQPACSSDERCKWSVIIVGMNGHRGRGPAPSIGDFVEREIAAGKKVIIMGHPDPRPERPSSSEKWMTFMDEHQTVAAMHPGTVWFIDTRTDSVFGDAQKALAEGYY